MTTINVWRIEWETKKEGGKEYEYDRHKAWYTCTNAWDALKSWMENDGVLLVEDGRSVDIYLERSVKVVEP